MMPAVSVERDNMSHAPQGIHDPTDAFYIDVSAAFRVLLFIPRPSSEHMCFRETTHALNIDDLPAQTYKMGLLFSPKHDNNGFIILSQNIFIHSIASLSCEPTTSTWV